MFKVQNKGSKNFLGAWRAFAKHGKTWRTRAGAVKAARKSLSRLDDVEIVEYKLVEVSRSSALEEHEQLTERVHARQEAKAQQDRNARIAQLEEELKQIKAKL